MSEAASMKLSELIDRLVEDTSGEKVSLGELLDALHTRSYGPLLLAPGLLAASPIGAIPGMSILTGSIILLISLQILVGRKRPWIPKRLLEFEFDRDRLTRTREKIGPWLEWAERPVQSRWTALVEPPFTQIIAACCAVLALSFYPLALVPAGVFMPAVTICFFALALSARDGVLTLFALVLTAMTGWAAYAFWPF